MTAINMFGIELQLLSEKAIYVKSLDTLLVSDIHLGKSETFQALGVPIPNTVNQGTLDRLQQICCKLQPKNLIVLGDLFHSKFALLDEVVDGWSQFCSQINADIRLVVGNHDRKLAASLEKFSVQYSTNPIQIENLILSHEPYPQSNYLNICGHIHPCIRIKTKLDNLRLPCFYFQKSQRILILPSFGEFTGGHEMPLKSDTIAYAIVDDSVISFEG